MLVDLVGRELKENFKLESENLLISKEKKNSFIGSHFEDVTYFSP